MLQSLLKFFFLTCLMAVYRFKILKLIISKKMQVSNIRLGNLFPIPSPPLPLSPSPQSVFIQFSSLWGFVCVLGLLQLSYTLFGFIFCHFYCFFVLVYFYSFLSLNPRTVAGQPRPE